MKNFISIVIFFLLFCQLLHSEQSKRVFDHLIEPVLTAKCVHCHGEQKSNGKLRMDSKERLLQGGEGAGKDIIIKGDFENSELIFRISLPKEDIEAMPPVEDDHDYNPVTSQEFEVMKAWIKLGANFDLVISELDETAKRAAEHIFKNMPKKTFIASKIIVPPPPQVPEVDPKILQTLKETGALIMPIAQNTNALYVNASHLGKEFDDEKLKLLEPLVPQLLWLNLARTGISNAGGKTLAKFSLLTRLHLENTSISDEISTNLKNLSALEYLNLYGTEISDSSVQNLKSLNNLQKIFLWQTNFTPNGIELLRKEFVDRQLYSKLKVLTGNLSKKVQNVTDEENKKVSILEKILLKVGNETKDLVPINSKCPIASNKDIDLSNISVFEGRKVGFCCQKCKAKFDKEPSTYRSKILEFKPSKNYSKAFTDLQKAQASMDLKIENVGADLRITSAKLKALGPQINIGWNNP